MGTRAQFMQGMESYLGVAESPPGSNMTRVGQEYGWNGVAWCAMTTSLAAAKAGFPWFHTAGVHQARQWAQDGYKGLQWLHPDQAIAADMFVLGDATHIGMVAFRQNGGFGSVEGNWGDACRRVLRSNWNDISGIIRLPFVDAVPAPTPGPGTSGVGGPGHYADPNKQQIGDSGDLVNMLQVRLDNIRAVLMLAGQKAWGPSHPDGIFGPITQLNLQAFQAHFGIPNNGVNDWLTAGKMAAVEAFAGIHYWS